MQRDEMSLTDNNRADARMIEDPSSSYVCDAHAPVAVADVAEEGEQRLEESPVAPYLENHIEILSQEHPITMRNQDILR